MPHQAAHVRAYRVPLGLPASASHPRHHLRAPRDAPQAGDPPGARGFRACSRPERPIARDRSIAQRPLGSGKSSWRRHGRPPVESLGRMPSELPAHYPKRPGEPHARGSSPPTGSLAPTVSRSRATLRAVSWVAAPYFARNRRYTVTDARPAPSSSTATDVVARRRSGSFESQRLRPNFSPSSPTPRLGRV
jgi:hypothetical protein